jgi:hypothetical protein
MILLPNTAKILLFRTFVPVDKRKNILSIEAWERNKSPKNGSKVLILLKILLFPNAEQKREQKSPREQKYFSGTKVLAGSGAGIEGRIHVLSV